MTAVVSEHHTVEADGVEIRKSVLASDAMDAITAEVSVDHEIMRRTGIRNLEKKFGSIARVATAPSVVSVAASILGATPWLVRALFIDKTPVRNWFVCWHQDCGFNRSTQQIGKIVQRVFGSPASFWGARSIAWPRD